MLSNIARVFSVFRLPALSFRPGRCPACGPTLFIKIADHEMGVRCARCRATPVTLSLIAVARDLGIQFRDKSVYELSSRGPLFRFLAREAGLLTGSEYLDGVVGGEACEGIQCQDVEHLTFGDGEFDICTSTEVFEHVADDTRGFSEIRRVLVVGGVLLFTVPMNGEEQTVERARREGNEIHHLLEPEYHGDQLRGQGQVLCFRVYGTDIVDRLLAAGFSSAAVHRPRQNMPWGYERSVIVARR